MVVDLSPPVNDKTNHYLAFFGLGLLLCYVTNSPSSSPRLLRRFGLVALIGLCYAAFDEITQGLVPGRDPDPIDFLADAMGLIAAIVLYLVARRLFRRSPPNPEPDRQS